MAAFSYTALRHDGTKAAGELNASDRQDALRRLERNGLQPVAVKPKEEGAAAESKLPTKAGKETAEKADKTGAKALPEKAGAKAKAGR